MLVSVCALGVAASTLLPATVLPPPPDPETLSFAAWLGALSMIAGALSQKGPHAGL
jgi:hypothetical protein